MKQNILQESKSRFLYKYCNLETALKIVSSGHILLRPPDAFNDPFDCLKGINVFTGGSAVRFPPSKDDVEYVLALLQKLPEKFRLPPYRMIHDRVAYRFAITCFTPKFDNHLMWSHYAASHAGVCLEFGADDAMAYLHPCLYSHRMPSVPWNTDAIGLPLIKNHVWNYEEEWRYVKRTIRSKMRLFGTISSDIYNAVHSNKAFSRLDYEEWSKIGSFMQKELEDTYNNELKLTIKPTAIYCGLNFGKSGNTSTQEHTKELLDAAVTQGIQIHKIIASHQSFDLETVQIAPPFGPMTFFG